MLEGRMDAVYQRYLSQFSAMESIMASMKGIKGSLKGQLDLYLRLTTINVLYSALDH